VVVRSRSMRWKDELVDGGDRDRDRDPSIQRRRLSPYDCCRSHDTFHLDD
jgi:hypothetical protein